MASGSSKITVIDNNPIEIDDSPELANKPLPRTSRAELDAVLQELDSDPTLQTSMRDVCFEEYRHLGGLYTLHKPETTHQAIYWEWPSYTGDRKAVHKVSHCFRWLGSSQLILLS